MTVAFIITKNIKYTVYELHLLIDFVESLNFHNFLIEISPTQINNISYFFSLLKAVLFLTPMHKSIHMCTHYVTNLKKKYVNFKYVPKLF